MFSGIIEDLGEIVEMRPRGNGRTLVIRTTIPVAPAGEAGVGTADRERVGLGDSIAVMGACLSVEAVQPPDRFTVAAGAETLRLTSLGARKVGDPVHLERSLRLGDRLDGHLVSGHVDGLGHLEEIRQEQESWVLWVRCPSELARYVTVKGSIAVDGVSLTVNELRPSGSGGSTGAVSFRINIIPFTVQHTTLGRLRVGQAVNLEVDQVARYLERLVGGGGPAPGGLSIERLAELGYGPTGRHGGS